MGAGHFWYQGGEALHLHWCDLVDYEQDEHAVYEDTETEYDQFIQAIRENLPASFDTEVDEWDSGRDAPRIIAVNGLHKIMVKDWETCLYVIVAPRDDLYDADGRNWEGFATTRTLAVRDALCRRLSAAYGYKFSVRTSAWTSGAWKGNAAA